jgi:4-hydroxybenzoate polyprenyltransferase
MSGAPEYGSGGIALPDAAPANWVDLRAPRALRPWLRLARLDRPVGIPLLLLPGWQGLTLAAAAQGRAPDLRLAALFALGATLMRAAGCAVNDMADRDLDAKVARTARRPLASGEISRLQAGAFALVCTALSAGILLTFNALSLWVAVAALPLVAAYPFMKRITWWPQAWLGLTFNWGALLGCVAAAGGASLLHLCRAGGLAAWLAPPDLTIWPTPAADLALYASGVAWTLGYDTIYAMQDMADDRTAGVRSSALRLGGALPVFVRGAYLASTLLAGLAGSLAHLGPGFFVGLAVFAIHLGLQTRGLGEAGPDRALRLFKSNVVAGSILTLALAAGAVRLG